MVIIENNGKICTIRNKQGVVLAEILVHGFLERALDSNGIYVFRGELYQLAQYEYLDKENQMITEKEDFAK